MRRNNFLGVVLSALISLGFGACAPSQMLGGNQASIVVSQELIPNEAALPSTAVGTYQGPVSRRSPFRWTRVGGDRCNPDVGCTLEFALARSGWPVEVQRAMLRKVQTQRGHPVTITRGWRGGMTWGSRIPKHHPDTLADFDQLEPALEWAEVHNGVENVVTRVAECGNWATHTRAPTLAPLSPPRPALPLVACR